MSLYHINEADVMLPAECSDQSMNIFTLGTTEELRYSLVITRDTLTGDESLRQFATDHLTAMGQTLPGYQFLTRGQTHIDDLPVETVEFLWYSEHGPMHQKQAYLFYAPSPATRTALTLTGTCREPVPEENKNLFERLLLSFRFHS
jgi:hypothetical protein